MIQDEINKVIMEEIGLTIDNQNRVIDQDTRGPIQFKEKNMKYSSQNAVTLGHSDIPFDPGINKNLMGSLFDYYAKKIEDEGEGYVSRYYETYDDKGNIVLEAKTGDGVIRSGAYNNQSLMYVDVIKQLNGRDGDCSEYDRAPAPIDKVVRKKRKPKSLFDK